MQKSEYKSILEINDFMNIFKEIGADLSNDTAYFLEFALFKKLLSIDSITSKVTLSRIFLIF